MAACLQPGVSMAAVALSRGINANLLRRWVREAERAVDADGADDRGAARGGDAGSGTGAFVPLQLPAPVRQRHPHRTAPRRDDDHRDLAGQAAGECAAWLRELLR